MKKDLTRKQMIALIASDYGFGPEITNMLTDETLKETCNHSHPNHYLGGLLELGDKDIFLPEYQDDKQ